MKQALKHLTNIDRLQILIVIGASLSTLPAIDIFLPSFPSMAAYFKVHKGTIQFAISFYLLGSLLSIPILGILSDKYSRLSVVFFGLTVFLFGTVICINSSSVVFFLWGRFIQGFGAVVSHVVGWVILQEIPSKDEGANILSLVGGTNCLVHLVAPSLGGYIHTVFGWQGNFVLLLLPTCITLFLILFLKLNVKSSLRKRAVSSLNIVKTYANVINNKPFLYYISFFSFLSCGLMCYLTFLPFYAQNSLQLPPTILGLYLSGSFSFYIFGLISSPIILPRLGMSKTLFLGIMLTLIGSLALLCISVSLPTSLILILAATSPYFFGTALIWGPSTSSALKCFNKIKGAASAVRSFLLIFSSVLGSAAGIFLNDFSLTAISLLLLIMASMCWRIFRKLEGILNFTT